LLLRCSSGGQRGNGNCNSTQRGKGEESTAGKLMSHVFLPCADFLFTIAMKKAEMPERKRERAECILSNNPAVQAALREVLTVGGRLFTYFSFT